MQGFAAELAMLRLRCRFVHLVAAADCLVCQDGGFTRCGILRGPGLPGLRPVGDHIAQLFHFVLPPLSIYPHRRPLQGLSRPSPYTVPVRRGYISSSALCFSGRFPLRGSPRRRQTQRQPGSGLQVPSAAASGLCCSNRTVQPGPVLGPCVVPSSAAAAGPRQAAFVAVQALCLPPLSRPLRPSLPAFAL